MKFRKKPVVIEAVRWTSHNLDELRSFMAWSTNCPDQNGALPIITLEGIMRASVGDWIIKGVKGEFYPCKPDVFDATYERVDG